MNGIPESQRSSLSDSSCESRKRKNDGAESRIYHKRRLLQCDICKKRYNDNDKHECIIVSCSHEFIDFSCDCCLNKMKKPIARVERKVTTQDEIDAKIQKEIEIAAEKTIAGASHLDMKSNFKRKSNSKYVKHCDICKVNCYSEDYWKAHVNGRKHREAVAEGVGPALPDADQDDAGVPHSPQKQQPYIPTTKAHPTDKTKVICLKCNCNISRHNLPRHLRNCKGDVQIVCKPCGQCFKTKQAYTAHCKSRKHKLKVPDDKDDDVQNNPATLRDEREAIEEEQHHDGKGRGNLFLCTFQAPIKYKLVRKIKLFQCHVCNIRFENAHQLRSHNNSKKHRILKKTYGKCEVVTQREIDFDNEKWIDGFAIGNEFGVTEMKGHCHAVLRTTEKLTFEEMKIKMRNTLGPLPLQDIERVRNIRNSIRYVTKEDPYSVIVGFDNALASVLYKAHAYAQNHKVVSWSDATATSISPVDRKAFEDYVVKYNKQINVEEMRAEFIDCELNTWQAKLFPMVQDNIGNNREIIWVHDQDGNSGKTWFGKYLQAQHNAIMFSNTSEKDVFYAYNKEPVVIFDVARQTKTDHLNFDCMEHLKNGCIFSNKYESIVKAFKPPAILCLSNSLPKKSNLTIDRWVVVQIVDKCRLHRVRCFNEPGLCFNTLCACNNKV